MKKGGMKRAALLLLALLLTVLTGMVAAEPEKVVYLTFDDGPTGTTPELLAILDELQVPATFFMVGFAAMRYPENTRAVVAAGHAVGCHTMDHASGGLQEGTEAVDWNFRRFEKEMRLILEDESFATDLFRFPGGSTSYPYTTKRYVNEAGWAWFDWNAMTCDTYEDMNRTKVLKSVRNSTGSRDVVILLAHEGKKLTRDALPEIVAFYRERGYEFRRLSTAPEEREILSRCDAHLSFPLLPAPEDTQDGSR